MNPPKRVISVELDSRVLAGNPLNDPTRRHFPVYLPPGYHTSQHRYPVLYALAPFTGTGPSMVHREPWSESLDQRLDRLIAGGCPPAIVVMPDCFTRYGGSQYLNSNATGRYEDYLLAEILPEVDRRFRTIASAEGRGVFGKSSGGYGALRMGLFHADRFCAVGCHSGDMFFELCYAPDFPKFLNAIDVHGSPESFVEQFYHKHRLRSEDIIAMSVLAMAAAYSPDPQKPLGIDFPFDFRTCKRRADVWHRWQQHDPVDLLDSCTDSLKRLNLLFLDCGNRDEYNLHFGARLFQQKAEAAGIPLEYQEFSDGHRGLDYRYDVSIPKLLGALAHESSS